MVTIVVWLFALAALLFLGSVASYLRLVMRRLTPVAALKLFQTDKRGGRIKVDRELVGISISALHGATMATFAVGVTGLFVFLDPQHLWENLGASVLVVSCAVALFDQFIPFLLVVRHDEPEVILGRWMPWLHGCVFVALPLTFPVLISTTVRRLLEPAQAHHEAPQAEEDLQELIEAGEQEGLIEKAEGELLHSMVEFGEKVVGEVKTPRTEIAALDVTSSVEDLRSLLHEKRHTRYPVYTGQLDHIDGIVNVRDVMELAPEEQSRVSLRSLVRPVPFVPETKLVKDLLKELQQTTTQLAIVIDEYGSVSGLVTIEDLVEEIVGDIRDEVETHARDIVKESANSYVVAGNTELARIADQLNVTAEEGDYSTVAGLVLARLGHVPSPGEKIELKRATLEVLEADQRTVLKVRLRFSSQTPAATVTHARPQSV